MAYLLQSTSAESSHVKAAVNCFSSSKLHSILDSQHSDDILPPQNATPEFELMESGENYLKTSVYSEVKESI